MYCFCISRKSWKKENLMDFSLMFFWYKPKTNMAFWLCISLFEHTINTSFDLVQLRNINCCSLIQTSLRWLAWCFWKNLHRVIFKTTCSYVVSHAILSFQKHDQEHNGGILNCYCMRHDLSGEPSSFYIAVVFGPGPLRSVLCCGRVMATTLNKCRVV